MNKAFYIGCKLFNANHLKFIVCQRILKRIVVPINTLGPLSPGCLPKYPAFFILGLNDENAKRRHDQGVDLRGSVGPRNDDVVKPFVCPLVEKQRNLKCG